MKIKILLKSAAKTRGVEEKEYEVANNLCTLKDLIVNLCDIEIDKLEQKEFSVMTQTELNAMVNQGKISFGFRYRDTEINREEAYENALLSFEDGLIRLFINECEVESLSDNLKLEEGDTLTLIRLVMMTGWLSY